MTAGEQDEAPLLARYDGLFLDLDGVVFHGNQAVPGAPEALARARSVGTRLAFITNNASRTQHQVAAHLRSMDIEAGAAEVVTAPMAAVQLLRERIPPGAAVLVVGGDGIIEALRDGGFTPVHRADDQPVAVVQGWAPIVDWNQLAEATVAVRAGAWWVATNLDATLPSERGPLPGNGSMVAALATATGQQPVSVGKPEPALFHTAAQVTGAKRALMVGDRLETDIEGAIRAGMDSLCVLSGVTTAEQLRTTGTPPTYVGTDISAVHQPPESFIHWASA